MMISVNIILKSVSHGDTSVRDLRENDNYIVIVILRIMLRNMNIKPLIILILNCIPCFVQNCPVCPY